MLNKEQQLNEAHMAYNFIKALDHVTSVIPYMEMLKFNICMYSKYANEYFRLIKVQHGNWKYGWKDLLKTKNKESLFKTLSSKFWKNIQL